MVATKASRIVAAAKGKGVYDFSLRRAHGTDAAIKVEYEDNDYLFFVETWGQLSCKEIVKTAIEQFTKKMEELEKVC